MGLAGSTGMYVTYVTYKELTRGRGLGCCLACLACTCTGPPPLHHSGAPLTYQISLLVRRFHRSTLEMVKRRNMAQPKILPIFPPFPFPLLSFF